MTVADVMLRTSEDDTCVAILPRFHAACHVTMVTVSVYRYSCGKTTVCCYVTSFSCCVSCNHGNRLCLSLQMRQDDRVSAVCGAEGAAIVLGQLSPTHGERRLPGRTTPCQTP